MKKLLKPMLLLVLVLALVFTSAACSGEKSLLSKDNPTMITVWTYYNGNQQESFDSLVSEFNHTAGAESGIIVKSLSQGGIKDLSDQLLNSVDNKVGAQELPQLAMVYPETAYSLKDKALLVDFDQYFTKEELSEYIAGFIDEGRLAKDSELVIFPVAKSTEVFLYNKTDWDVFAADTGVYAEEISSVEDVTAAAETYYNWSDQLTPNTPNDGKALFGRDSMDNYMLVGAAQLGHPIFTIDDSGVKVDLDRGTMRTLWDNYYVPFINGYFEAYGRFRSDDTKTGQILSYVGSSSSSSYFPDEVTLEDDSSHAIESGIIPAPVFRDAAEKYSVQQGAGFCGIKGTDAQAAASAQFLKWFTDEKQNIEFSVGSGYLPVKITSNNFDKLKSAVNMENMRTLDVENLRIGAEVIQNDKLFVMKPFDGQSEARQILKTSMSDWAIADREEIMADIKSGTDHETAVLKYNTDENFEKWYKSLTDIFSELVA